MFAIENKMSLKEEILDLEDKLNEIKKITIPHWDRLHKMKEQQKNQCRQLITEDLKNKLSKSNITSGIYQKSIILPCNNMEIKSSYSSGSYYDKSETTYYLNCSLCGLYKEFYSSYGGYG